MNTKFIEDQNKKIIKEMYATIKVRGEKLGKLAFQFTYELQKNKKAITIKDFEYVAHLLNYKKGWAEIKFKEYQKNEFNPN